MISEELKRIIKPSPCDYHDDNHTYTAVSDGKLWPGATGITDNLNKPFLVPWAAKECAEGVKSKRVELQKANAKEFNEIVDSCKSIHKTKSTAAKDSGTIAHEWIEHLIEGNPDPYPEDPEAANAVEQFEHWLNDSKVDWLASELVVGSAKHEFGGTLDSIAILNRIPTLIDFKTSSQISKDYFLQTAGYQLALEEMGVPIWQRYILRLPKDGSPYESLVVPTPYELDRDAFLGLRETQRWQSYIGNGKYGILDTQGRVKTHKSNEN